MLEKKENNCKYQEKNQTSSSRDSNQGSQTGERYSVAVCCILVAIICFGLTLIVGLLYWYGCLKVFFSVIIFAVGIIVNIITFLSFFGIIIKVNSSKVKAVLGTISVSFIIGVVLSYAIYLVTPGDIDSNPQPTETVQSESENPDTQSPLPSGDIANVAGEEDEPMVSVNPTEIPSHVDPTIVTPDPEPPAPARSYVIRAFYQLIGSADSMEDELIVPSATEKDYYCAFLVEKLRYLVNTDTQMDSIFVNGDNNFTSLTSKANRLAEDIASNGRTIAKQLKLIELREAAYELYQTYNLRCLLSDDYFTMAKRYRSEGQHEETYQYCLKSIEYELLAIRLCPETGDSFYIHLYRLATRLHTIGDLKDLATDNKIEAYYLSMCLFEAVSKSDLSQKGMDYQAGSYYYAGMSNHKLMSLTWGKKDSDSGYYFLDAYNYYLNSLNFKVDEKHKYDYLANLCAWVPSYIRRFGRIDGMLTIDEYKQLQAKYSEYALLTGND